MKKFIISEEEKSRILNLHEGVKKGTLNEQSRDYTGSQYYTKVEGPFKDVGLVGTGDIYVMKLEKGLCRYDTSPSDMYRQVFVMTGSTCGEGFTTIPGGKFYIQQESDGKIVTFHKDSRHYVSATNNGQGYNTLEDAKKGASLLLNPKGHTGRTVVKGTDNDGTEYKQVTKYNRQGDVQKSRTKMTTATGNKSVERRKSGL
jgi:hypothetical protein